MHQLSITEISSETSQTFDNLFNYYLHDMAQWFKFETNDQGRYVTNRASPLITGEQVYLAHIDNNPAGFAIVGSAKTWTGEASSHDMAEFFVLRRYRQTGVALELAAAVWDRYPGQWLVRVFKGNLSAIPFWNNAVAQYTGGNFKTELRNENSKDWQFFTFNAPRFALKIRA